MFIVISFIIKKNNRVNCVQYITAYYIFIYYLIWC